MEKKIPKLTVQLLAAIAVTLALVMIVENYFSVRLSDTLQVQFTFIHFRCDCWSCLGSCLCGDFRPSLCLV